MKHTEDFKNKGFVVKIAVTANVKFPVRHSE